ncbi:MAG: hypothetical protein ACPL0C_03055 [Candidatus Bathyarchaeales archaeon]
MEEERTPKNLSSNDAAIVSWHKCDICGSEEYTIYVLQLDKWYCVDCIHTACKLVKTLT